MIASSFFVVNKNARDDASKGGTAGKAAFGASRRAFRFEGHGAPAHDQALHMIATSFHLILRLSSETSGEKVTSTTDVPPFRRAPVVKRQSCAT